MEKLISVGGGCIYRLFGEQLENHYFLMYHSGVLAAFFSRDILNVNMDPGSSLA